MVTPNTNLRLYSLIPLDVDQLNTILFDTIEKQRSYFAKREYTFSKLQYVRHNDGVIKVAQPADEVNKCNYMSFQNNAYSDKWFYAFITAVDYVNDNTCLVHFKIDVLQTYMFDYTLPICFVVREHTNDDTIGVNYQPEPIDLGEIIQTDTHKERIRTETCLVAGTAITGDGDKINVGRCYGGLVQGVNITPLNVSIPPSSSGNMTKAINNLKDAIDKFTDANAEDSIVGLINIPFYAVSNLGSGNGTYEPATKDVDITPPDNLDGYKPRNKKLLCYPYTFLAVDVGSSCANYKFEYFAGRKPTCRQYYTMSPTPEIAVVPLSYNGQSQNFTEEIKMGNFGQVSYSVDAYKAWWAQNASTYNLQLKNTSTNYQIAQAKNAISSVGGAIGSAFSGNIGGVVSNAVNGTVNAITNELQYNMDLANIQNQQAVAMNQPAHARGVSSTDVDLVSGGKAIYYKTMSMRAVNAAIADDYLDMFGYSTNRLKVPNIRGREYWNYIQTKGMNLTGQMPNDAAQELSAIYDRGVRFWHHPTVYGDYSKNNHIK